MLVGSLIPLKKMVVLTRTSVYGLGIDITTVLAVMSSTVAGNLVSFSLGGQTTKVTSLLGLLGSLLGTPQGIDHTHNLIESDGSSTRDDIYMTGDSWTMNMTKFMEVYNSIDPNGGMTFDDMGQRSANRWNQSVANNPYFYYGPWSGMFGRSGGYLFATRLMSNHSVDHPRGGYLSKLNDQSKSTHSSTSLTRVQPETCYAASGACTTSREP